MKLKMTASKYIVLAFLMVIILASALFAVSAPDSRTVNLVEGKNTISFNVSNPFSVETFVKLNPAIETVSYHEGNETVGYVNTFGGVGKNFLIESGKDYEIFSSSNITLNIPG